MYPNLKLQMWKSGMRQNQLAQMLGMHETALSRIVNGYRPADAEVRAQIAAVLECDEAWLFEPREGAVMNVRTRTAARGEQA